MHTHMHEQVMYVHHMHTHRHTQTHTCTQTYTNTHLNLAVIEEPAGQTHNSGVTPVVDEQLRLMYPGYFTRQLAVLVVEAHKEGVC